MRDKRVLAFSAIARPQAFTRQLRGLGANVVAQTIFPDHHWYSATELQELVNKFRRTKADFTVTTAKDAVKLPIATAVELNLMVLDQKVSWQTEHPLANLLSSSKSLTI